MNKTVIALATAASLALAAGPSLAQTSNQNSGPQSQSGMSNSGSDGGMQGSGMQDSQMTFERLDENGDGYLDEDELSAYGSSAAGDTDMHTGQRADQLMEKLDQDGDGQVSEQEMRQSDTMSHPGGMKKMD